LTLSGEDHSKLLVRNFFGFLFLLIDRHGLPVPSDEMIDSIIWIAGELLPLDVPKLPAPPTAADDYHEKKVELEVARIKLQSYRPEVAQEMLALCIIEFLKAIPKAEHVMWMAPAKEVVPLSKTVAAMTWALRDGALFQSAQLQAAKGAAIAAKNTRSREEQVWPQDYDGPDIIKLYLLPVFQRLFECEVPFGFKKDDRFVGQWVMGAPKSGKTTLLSAQIEADLERVERNECSIFVMDSQDRVVPDIAKLKRFAPGGPMHDRLIYIEPSVTHTPALNIFGIDRERLKRLSPDDRFALDMSRIEMIEYFLASLLKLSLTDKQSIPFSFILPAVLEIPNATVETFANLLKDDGFERYKEHLSGLDKVVYDWFEEHYRPRGPRERHSEFAESRAEIAGRIQGMFSKALFRRMFCHPERKLDLFAEMQKGKVILINTRKGVLRKFTEPWGRFFLAQIMQAVEERMLVDRHSNMPCFCYVDEAADYLADEGIIKAIFTQGRKQNVGMVISHHDEDDIGSPKAMAALRKAAIRMQPAGIAHTFRMEITNQQGFQLVKAPNVDFNSPAYEQMTPNEWQDTLRVQRAKYCIPLAITDQSAATARRQVADSEEADEDSFDEE
jgi:hypothetical protein